MNNQSLEFNTNGCLGLDRVNDIVRNGAELHRINMHVDHPSRKGKGLAITTGGHQSAENVVIGNEEAKKSYGETVI
ncbi:unnamed protein product [[Candida] boidinii]|uniref:Unnamed protein product n=1 Tax=Candida boidinii TaxID=5477 RepID=A0A9W6SX77_CANBO|nr:unnamed protein product [[Candida] boidinii]GMF52128.1 unnamed protein product [[Candida] boidinii]GMF99286.1 unnamed protein product [[Candida] boidinii]